MIKKITNVFDFLGYLSEFWENKEDSDVFIYRGLEDSSYELMPTLLRGENLILEDEECHYAELEFPEEFDRHHHLSTLVKMRHYGAKTRILDFTRNPLIALYFACSNTTNEKDGRVVVIKENKNNIKHHGSDTILVKSCISFINDKDRKEISKYCKSHMNVVLKDKTNGPEKTAIHHLYHEIRSEYPAFESEILADDILKNHFVAANKDNERMKVQDGLFAFFGLDTRRCLKELNEKVICKIDIPKIKKTEILKELEMLRINDSTVYPGVERSLLNLNLKILKQERKY